MALRIWAELLTNTDSGTSSQHKELLTKIQSRDDYIDYAYDYDGNDGDDDDDIDDGGDDNDHEKLDITDGASTATHSKAISGLDGRILLREAEKKT